MQRADDPLDQQLLAAHAAGDHGALVTLYCQAADTRETSGDTTATCFYLTHAYVFALEQGMADAAQIHGRLKSYGAEQ